MSERIGHITEQILQFRTNRRNFLRTTSAGLASVTAISFLGGETPHTVEAAGQVIYPSFQLEFIHIEDGRPTAPSSKLIITAEERVVTRDQIKQGDAVLGRINGTDQYVIGVNYREWVQGESNPKVSFTVKADTERNNCPAKNITFRNVLGVRDGERILTDDPVTDSFIENCCSRFKFKQQPFQIIEKPKPEEKQPEQPAPQPVTPQPTPQPAPAQLPKTGDGSSR